MASFKKFFIESTGYFIFLKDILNSSLPVEEFRIAIDYLYEHSDDTLALFLHHLTTALDGKDRTELDEHMEELSKLNRELMDDFRSKGINFKLSQADDITDKTERKEYLHVGDKFYVAEVDQNGSRRNDYEQISLRDLPDQISRAFLARKAMLLWHNLDHTHGDMLRRFKSRPEEYNNMLTDRKVAVKKQILNNVGYYINIGCQQIINDLGNNGWAGDAEYAQTYVKNRGLHLLYYIEKAIQLLKDNPEMRRGYRKNENLLQQVYDLIDQRELCHANGLLCSKIQELLHMM